MALKQLLLVAAFVCFLVASFAQTPRVNLVAVGLALWVATLIVP
jgi:hypothetical protein